MSYVVLEHHLDEAAGVYRLVVGWQEEHAVQMLDADGEPVMGPDVQMLDVNGDPVFLQGELVTEEVPVGDEGETVRVPKVVDGQEVHEQGPPLMKRGEVLTEQVQLTVAYEDFVFSADDERWFTKDGKRRRAEETIAEIQRGLVMDQIKVREAAREEAATSSAAIKPMPGVGGAL